MLPYYLYYTIYLINSYRPSRSVYVYKNYHRFANFRRIETKSCQGEDALIKRRGLIAFIHKDVMWRHLMLPHNNITNCLRKEIKPSKEIYFTVDSFLHTCENASMLNKIIVKRDVVWEVLSKYIDLLFLEIRGCRTEKYLCFL